VQTAPKLRPWDARHTPRNEERRRRLLDAMLAAQPIHRPALDSAPSRVRDWMSSVCIPPPR
jgi:hypothetical protein